MPNSVCTVSTQQRGPVLNIAMSTMYFGEDCRDVGTGCINVNHLAEVYGIFRSTRDTAGLHIVFKSKKSEAAKNLIVSINISPNKSITKTQIICQDEWTEVPIGRLFNGIGGFNTKDGYVGLYIAEINITIHATMTMPAAPIASKLYEDTEFTDFTLQAADGDVAFHKNILSIQSDMFRTMLRGQWKETREGSMNMDGLSLQTLKHLKDFMYLGTVPDEGLEPLLLVARRCLMDNLAAACIEKLITTVTPETLDGLAEFACQNNIIELVRAFARVPDHVVNGIRWYN